MKQTSKFAAFCPNCGELIFITINKNGKIKDRGHSKKCPFYKEKEKK
jgi:predicted RNA-binding Zn-ribbon protein involved in translation (DUF1610 family)